MSEITKQAQALTNVSKPAFGEWFTGIYASDDNPKKHGRYVRTIRRRGRMNPGTFYELTDGHGVFWQYPIDSVVRRDELMPEHDEDAWRDYDHGFRDGYQAALREQPNRSQNPDEIPAPGSLPKLPQEAFNLERRPKGGRVRRVDEYGDLLQAARWVVKNWDRQATQHASMPALRKAVQRRDEDATKP